MRCTEISSLADMQIFAQKAKHFYIYGMGKYGQLVYSALRGKNICFCGFIVTKRTCNKFLGQSVFSFDEIIENLTEADSILIGMGDNSRREIIQHVVEKSRGKIGIVEDEIFRKISKEGFRQTIETLAIERPPTPYTGENDFNNILVVRLDRMGDLIWTSAFLRELRCNFPSSTITVVITQGNIPILKECPYIDRIIGYEYSYIEEMGGVPREEVLQRAKKFAEEYLQHEKYDVVFLPRGLQPDSDMANVFLAVYSSARYRVANYFMVNAKLEKWFEVLSDSIFSLVVRHEKPVHETIKILDMLRAIGCIVNSDKTEVWASIDKIKHSSPVSQLHLLRGKFQKIIAVGLITQDKQKNWDAENFRKLFKTVGEECSVCFLLLGGKEATEVADKAVVNSCCVDLTGKTDWNEVVHVMEMSDLYFGLDTGLVHLAAALEKPVIELACQFPWGDDNMEYSMVRCGAWRTKSAILYPMVARDEKCAKAGQCIKKVAHCINNISVEDAINVLKNFLLYYNFR